MNRELGEEIQRVLSAGRIVMSDYPGKEMAYLRRSNGITQTQLAKFLDIKQPTIADYEKMRTKSPGCFVIKKWIEAITEIKKWKYKL